MNPDNDAARWAYVVAAVVGLACLMALVVEAHAGSEPTRWERRVVETALRYCKRGTDPYMLLAVLRVEERAALPLKMRGIVLATAIGEAACNATAYNVAENAHGLTQIRPRWWTCAGDLFDPIANVECWLARVVKLAHGKAQRRCPRHRWTAGEAWASQGWDHPRWPKPWYCKAVTGHLRRLRGWQSRKIWEEGL